jgi:hypothetical protein
MTTTKKKGRRWNCPKCQGGLNAPGRMRKDDIRRYCLGCSKATGRLVQRVCPALEKERTEREAKRNEKVRTTRAKQSARRRERKDQENERWAMPGFDIRKEADALWRLFCKRDPRLRTDTPRIELRRNGRRGRSGGGTAYIGPRKIRLTPTGPRWWVWTMLVHELAHIAVHSGGHPRVLYEAMKFVIEKRLRIPISFYGVRGDRWGYSVDRLIERQVREFIDACGAEKTKVKVA